MTKEERASYNKAYREKNREKIAEQRTCYIQKNREARREAHTNYMREYRENNERMVAYEKEYRDRNRLARKEYNERNKERISEERKNYRENNKEAERERSKAYKKDRRSNDPSFRVSDFIRASVHRMIREGDTRNLEARVGYTRDDLLAHLSTDPLFDKWNEDSSAYHLDHIIPIAAYGKLTWEDDDIKKVCNPRNLQILPAEENIRKKDKVDYALIESKGITDLLPQALLSAS